VSAGSRLVSTMQIATANTVSPRAVQLMMQRRGVEGVAIPGRGRPRAYPLGELPAHWQAAVLVKFPDLANTGAALAKGAAAEGAGDASGPAAAPPARDCAQAWALYERKPASIKAEAERRLKVVSTVAELMANGTGKLAAIAAAARAHGVPEMTTRCGWMKLVRGVPRADWLPALAPRWAGRTKTAEIESEAWDLFKADYLRAERPAMDACYERLSRIAAGRGWRLPAIATLKRRLAREVGALAITAARFGPEALKAMAHPAQRRDRSMFRPLEAVCADAHQFDNLVLWPDGSIDRPYALVWQDLATNRILSWRIGRNPCAELVRLSFGDVVEEHGVPDQAFLDNGREFASKWLSGGMKHRFRFKVKPDEPLGVFTQLGTEVVWVTPYSGQSKPIERAFGTLAERIAKAPDLAGSYTGNTPAAKPHNYGSAPAKLADFVRVVEREVAAFNDRASAARVLGGKSPNQAWAEKLPAAMVRKASPAQRALWLLAAEGVVARKPDGHVEFAGNRYWSDFLAGQAGSKLVIRFDPQRLHRPVFVYGLDGRFVGAAACIDDTGFRDTNAAQEHQRLRGAAMRAAKRKLEAEARLEAIEVARALEAPAGAAPPSPLVESKVLRPAAFGRPNGPMPEGPAELEKPKRAEMARLLELRDRAIERIARKRGIA
jgi:putative transposase